MRDIREKDYSKHRIDVGYDVTFKRLGPMVFEIDGNATLPTTARIDVQLWDKGYKMPKFKNFSGQIDTKATALVELGIHGIEVNGKKFHRKYDLSKDTKQYPFAKDQYDLIVSFDPHSNPENITDMVGINGERLTDKKYLDTSTPGVRKLVKVFHLSRKDIL